ncbi:nuclear transport factor 2 family protein [Nocardia yunnanensis]|uniref:Nuclear transport factor 2 family protein n=1 Tax=Nocardia yunnanensis TaxID=2382165 RepID=A0A386Z8X2_9NOCA|nr:nuclear transport factor 2 family protein [Nocardia yunnanensis]AYF74101.1 nuclear transport factor 2 family protein [Nocardia yunnanensis]
MSTPVETPRDLVERLFLGLPSRDADRFAALLAPDVVFEIPFPIPGEPTRIEGRERVREYLASRWSGTSGVQVHGIRPDIHETTDPEVFVVENDVDVTRPSGERGWFRSSVNVIRVRDGLVTLFRDYMDTGRILALRQAAQG